MNWVIIVGIALLVLVPLYFLLARPLRHHSGGREDHSERRELTGSEQYKRRDID